MENSKKWTEEIIPEWNSKYRLQSTIKMWWMGIPPKVRGQVWLLAVGNKCNTTSGIQFPHSLILFTLKEQFSELVARAYRVKELVTVEERQKQADFLAEWQ